MKDANSKLTSSHKIFLRAIELWSIYGPRYATNVDTYKFLLQQKRDLRIKPLSKIPEHIIREYPDIPFLKLRKLDDAKAYLEKLSVVNAAMLVHHIEYVVEYDHAYRTVSNRISEFEYQVKNHGKRKTGYGVDPNSIGNGKGSKGRNRGIDEGK